ncbi:MAG: hypothetical protein GY796_35900 [Chloroflexi bacterium]|nr:hypothetical protein [Chloroflexota bacterium]
MSEIIGDANSVGLAVPPQPLQANPQTPVTPSQTSNTSATSSAALVVPTAMSIQGGQATCKQTFNVLVTMTNVGNARSGQGTVTVQNIDRGKGQVTFTGYGNYPALDPGANIVVSVPVLLKKYLGSAQELRASNNGQQISLQYNLNKGACKDGKPAPKPSKQSSGVKLKNCVVTLNPDSQFYDKPRGTSLGTLPNGEYIADRGLTIKRKHWFRIQLAPGDKNSRVWIRDSSRASKTPECQFYNRG